MASLEPTWVQLLISGFVRKQEGMQKLSMHIPTGITLFIIDYYPLLYPIGLHDKNRFDVSDDGLSIQSSGDSCDGYMIYADLFAKDDIGFHQGIHLWSLKSIIVSRVTCFRSIGITTVRNKEMVEQCSDNFIGTWAETAEVEGYHYYFDATYWDMDVIFTIKLDCDQWKLFYYKDKTLLKSQDIEPKQNYFLAICCCDNAEIKTSPVTSLQVVPTPMLI